MKKLSLVTILALFGLASLGLASTAKAEPGEAFPDCWTNVPFPGAYIVRVDPGNVSKDDLITVMSTLAGGGSALEAGHYVATRQFMRFTVGVNRGQAGFPSDQASIEALLKPLDELEGVSVACNVPIK
jgi:hypothetical protein